MTTTTTQQSIAQAILKDTAALRQDMETILALAKATALPMEGEDRSFIDVMIMLLQMIVSKVEGLGESLEALHQRFDQPGIAMALRRMNDAD